MAQGIIPRDLNFITTVGAVSASTDTATSIRSLQYDASTRGLTVHIVGNDAGGDGTIVDGVSAAIKATVLDLTSANPLTTAIVDGDGVQITSFGGGTQYTEDAAAAANPVGTAPILVRTDTPATQVTTDGDNVAQRGTNYGAAYVQLVTSAGAYIDSVGGGTQYAVDAALGATPTGTLAVAIRDDALTTLTPVEGDAVGLRTGSYGDLWVSLATKLDATNDTVTANLSATDNAVLDAIEVDTTSIDAKIPALGQALAAGSTPVVLTANQITTLTPPAQGLTDTQLRATAVPISVATVPSHAVTNAGTFAVQAASTLAAETTKVIGTVNQGTSPWVTSNATTSVVGNGTAATAQRVSLANDSTGIVALTTSTASIGKLAANSGVDIGDVDILSVAAGTNLVGDVSLQPRTGNGCTIFRSIDLDETEEEIKATAGNLYGYFAFNAAATTHYIKFYNATAANVTVGTTTPVLTFPLPAGAAANISFAYPVGFSTAISAAATTGIADNDTGAPAASAVTLNVFYK